METNIDFDHGIIGKLTIPINPTIGKLTIPID